jgi:hypothetical protein
MCVTGAGVAWATLRDEQAFQTSVVGTKIRIWCGVDMFSPVRMAKAVEEIAPAYIGPGHLIKAEATAATAEKGRGHGCAF